MIGSLVRVDRVGNDQTRRWRGHGYAGRGRGYVRGRSRRGLIVSCMVMQIDEQAGGEGTVLCNIVLSLQRSGIVCVDHSRLSGFA
jgi:hypothetical protein